MKALYTERFNKSYNEAPPEARRAFDKQVQFLLKDIRYGSLRAKKYGVSGDIWQARINKSWRFYFTIKNDAYYI